MVEGDPTAVCQFQGPTHLREMTASYSSLLDGAVVDPYDFTLYMDFSPVTINSNAPLELVHQIFTKLGARFIMVNNLDGYCGYYLAQSETCLLISRMPSVEGIVDKKGWIAFVSEIPHI